MSSSWVAHCCNSLSQNSPQVTDHPAYPVRGVAFCSDAFVHVVCPRTGDVLTTAVSPRPKRTRLIDAAYAIEDGVLFAAYSDGVIAKFSTKSRPCLLESEWPCENPHEQVNYLLVYEYVITTAQGWSGFKKMFKTKAIEDESEEEEEERAEKASESGWVTLRALWSLWRERHGTCGPTWAGSLGKNAKNTWVGAFKEGMKQRYKICWSSWVRNNKHLKTKQFDAGSVACAVLYFMGFSIFLP